MKQEISDIFKLFEGDITSAALYLYLCTLLNANERLFISLKETSVKSGFSPRKIKTILSRLKNLGLIDYKILNNRGVQLVINNPLLVTYVTGLGQTTPEPMSYGAGCSVKSARPVSFDVGLTSMSVSSIPKLIPLVNSSSMSPTTKTTAKLETKTKSKTKSRRKKKPRSIPPEVKELAQEWFDWAAPRNPSTPFNLEKFEDAILAMTKGTQKTFEDIRNMFEFIKSDEKDEGFCYAENFESPCTWKNKWANGLTKMDSAFKEMKRRKFQSEKEKPKITQENISDFF